MKSESKEVPFRCRRCGRCCRWKGYVRVTAEEIDAIAHFLQRAPEEFIANATRLTGDRSGLSLLENADGSCVWLEADGDGVDSCILQAVKPAQCRNFPTLWNFPNWRNECAGGKADADSDANNDAEVDA